MTTEHLEAWVLHDRKPMTARLLAIKQRIHIDEARRQMQVLVDTHQGSSSAAPYATWLLTGDMAPVSTSVAAGAGGGSQESVEDSMDLDSQQDIDSQARDGRAQSQRVVSKMGMLLVDQAHLDEGKSRFTSSPRVQLYALSPPLPSKPTTAHRLAAVSQLTTVQHDLKSNSTYVKAWVETDCGASIGAIRAPDDIGRKGKTAAASVPRPGAAAEGDAKNAAALQCKVTTPIAAPVTNPSKADTKRDQTQPSASVSATRNAKDTSKSKPKPKRKLADSEDDEPPKSSTAAARQDSAEDEDDDGGPIGYTDEPAASKPKAGDVAPEEGGAQRKRADAGDKLSAAEEARRRRRQELIDMMDEDGEQDPHVPAAENSSTNMMAGSAKPSEAPSGGSKTPATASRAKPPKRRVRKQRKIMRKETTRNEKGYRVTRDVEGYESYSSDESSDDGDRTTAKDAKSEPKSKGRSKPAEGGSNKGKTQSLPEDAGNDIESSTMPAPAPAPPAAIPKTASDKLPASAPAKKGGGGGTGAGAGGGQRKLSSFFGKKG